MTAIEGSAQPMSCARIWAFSRYLMVYHQQNRCVNQDCGDVYWRHGVMMVVATLRVRVRVRVRVIVTL